jgi:hypothetical protein
MEKYGRAGQAPHDNMPLRITRWITKSTDKHSQYVIFTAFPRQQWLRERASMLRYTYFGSIRNFKVESYEPLSGTGTYQIDRGNKTYTLPWPPLYSVGPSAGSAWWISCKEQTKNLIEGTERLACNRQRGMNKEGKKRQKMNEYFWRQKTD